jgi:uridine kinase
MDVEVAAAALLERLPFPPAGALALACVDGMGGSGKSTLVEAVARLATGEITVVHGDDFYGPEKGDWRSWTPQQGYERYFDHARLEEQLLRPLRSGQSARFQRYDWTTNALADWVAVPPLGLVLVEGVYLLRARLRRYWDFAAYVDTPRHIRLARMYARGENDRGWIERWAAAEDFYQGAEDPAGAADLVVAGV